MTQKKEQGKEKNIVVESDTGQWDAVLLKLEEMEDSNPEEAARLLRELTRRSSALWKMTQNQEEELNHQEWQKNCQFLQEELDNLINTILRGE